MILTRKGILRFLLPILIALPVWAQQKSSPGIYNKIIEKGMIRIGISKNYPPLNFDSGKSGLEIEMSRELGKFLGVKVHFVPLDVAQYIEALKSEKIDIIIAGYSRNLERGKSIWFSEPYLSLTPGVLANKRALPQTSYGDEFEEAPVKTIWDIKRLSNFKFAVKEGSSYQHLLNSKFPDMQKIIVQSNEEGLLLLKKGKVDGFVHDSLFLSYLYSNSAKLSSSFSFLHGGSQMEKICIGLPFGDVILKNQVDLFIQEMIREGFITNWLKIYLQKK